jgi:hypothetical protein
MKKRDYIIAIGLLVVALLIIPASRELIAQTSYSVQGWLGLVTDTTNSSLQVSIVSTDTNQTIGGNLTVTGTSTLTGAVTASSDLTVNGFLYFPNTAVAQQSYTITSTGKAAGYIVNYTDTGAAWVHLPDTPTDGQLVYIKDGDLNASSNNLVITTADSATIDESATLTLDANGEATILSYSATGTDWNVIGGYLE